MFRQKSSTQAQPVAKKAKKASIDFNFDVVEKASNDKYDPEKFLIVKGLASTSEVDRHSDRIDPEAWNTKALRSYRKNPVILHQHNHSKLIGTAINIERTDKGLEVEAAIYRDFEEIGKIEDGVLKAFSVGFSIDKGGITYNEDEGIYNIKKLELLEISVVSVPSNRSSLFKLSKSSDLSDEELQEIKKSFISEPEEEPEADNQNTSKMLEKVKGLFALVITKLGFEFEVKSDDITEDNLESVVKSIADQVEQMQPVSEQIQKAVEDAEVQLNQKISDLETELSGAREQIKSIGEGKPSASATLELSLVKKELAASETENERLTDLIEKYLESSESGGGAPPTKIISDSTQKEFDSTVRGEAEFS